MGLVQGEAAGRRPPQLKTQEEYQSPEAGKVLKLSGVEGGAQGCANHRFYFRIESNFLKTSVESNRICNFLSESNQIELPKFSVESNST